MASRSAAPNLRDGFRENVLWVILTDVILDNEVSGTGDDGGDEGGEEAGSGEFGDPGGGVDEDDDDEVEELTSGVPGVSDDAVQLGARESTIELPLCSPDFPPS